MSRSPSFLLPFLCLVLLGQSLAAQEAEKLRLQRLANDHREALGGNSQLRSWQSIQATGTATRGEETVKVRLFRKRPANLRISWIDEKYITTQVANPDGVWMQTEAEGVTSPPFEPPTPMVLPLQAQAPFLNDLAAYPRDGVTYDLQMPEQDEEPIIVVTARPNGITRELHVDPDSHLIQREILRVKTDPRLKATVIDTQVEEVQPVEGLTLGFRYRVQQDDEEPWIIDFEEITINSGLLDTLFER